MAAAPKARGRQAALEQLAQKQLGAGAPASAGGGGLPSFSGGAPPASSVNAGPASSAVGSALERSTFAERVADVKDNVEKARQEYRNKATHALGSRPAAGPSAVTAGMHSKFADLEAMWGEVMDYTKIDPFSTATPGVKAAASGLARNRSKLDKEVDTILDDLWDGVSSGQARQMTVARKDEVMRKVLVARGTNGMPLSPTRRGDGGYDAYGQPGAQQDPQSPGMGGALVLPTTRDRREQQMDQQIQQQMADFGGVLAPPPAGSQDFETRRQLEIMRQDIMRLEGQVLLAVEAEEAELPPPPPLMKKPPAMFKAMQKAADFEEIAYRIQTSVVGQEPDSGGTPCNSVDDPSIPLIMPTRGGLKIANQLPAGGLKIANQLVALQKETNELKEAAVYEFGGPAARARMEEIQKEMKKDIRTKRN